MARQPKQVLDPEPVRDVWSNTWGDPALQELGRRLIDHGVTEERSATAVEQVWLFYSYEALPSLRTRLPMAIAFSLRQEHLDVFLYLPTLPATSNEIDSRGEHSAPHSASSHAEFAVMLNEHFTLHLERINLPFPVQSEARWLERYFTSRAEKHSRRHNLEFVGVFEDNLVAELGTVMDPDDVPGWLATPNVLLGGQAPIALIDKPLDRRLRDLITRAKFNLPAA